MWLILLGIFSLLNDHYLDEPPPNFKKYRGTRGANCSSVINYIPEVWKIKLKEK